MQTDPTLSGPFPALDGVGTALGPQLRIQVLGPTRLEIHDGAEDVRAVRCTDTERAFLAYLSITGREHPREHLAELFWPDRSSDQSLGNLRVLLSRLRKKVDPHLEVHRRSVALSEVTVHVDLDRLRRVLQDLESATPGESERAFLELVGPRGPRLADDPVLPEHPRLYDWLDTERAVLARRVDAARQRLAELFWSRGDLSAALEQSAARVAADVLDEARCREHMERLVAAGRRAEALACYEACRSALEVDLGLDPEPATAELARGLRLPPSREADEPAPRGDLEKRARAVLLERMERFWIERVLAPTLPPSGALGLLELERPDLVSAPWSHVEASRFQPRRREGSLLGQFYERGGALLLVGEPGGGKTVRLLQLAREALELARSDGDAAVPVVLHLGTWPDDPDGSELETWVLEELSRRYHVPRHVTARWSRHGRLLLLLDGLDELSHDTRRSFVRALGLYRRQAGLGAVALCCRGTVCEHLVESAGPIPLDAAVELRPLTSEQVTTAVSEDVRWPAGAAAHLLRDEDGRWRSLLRNPLMLSLTLEALVDGSAGRATSSSPGGSTADDVPSTEELARRVVRGFVDRVSSRAGGEWAELELRLVGLAQGMTQSGQGVFQIASVQPSWLPSAAARAVYLVASRAAGALAVAALMAVLASAVGSGWKTQVVIWVSSLAGALALAAIDGRRMGRHRGGTVSRVERGLLALVFAAGLFTFQLVLSRGLGLSGTYGLVFSTLSFVVLLVYRRRRLGRSCDIEPVAALAWSGSRSVVGAVSGAAWGALFGTTMYLLLAPGGPLGSEGGTSGPSLLASLVAAAVGPSLAGSIIGAVAKGLHEVASPDLERPNAGIHGSLRSAGLGALVMLLSLAVGMVLVLEIVRPFLALLDARPFFGLRHEGIAVDRPVVLVVALLLGGLAFLWYGGLGVLEHWTLRILLWRRGILPLRPAPFLTRAAELGLLRHQAGGTIFRHRALLDYFAEVPGR